MTTPERVLVELQYPDGRRLVQHLTVPLQITAAQRAHLEEATTTLLDKTGLTYPKLMVLLMEDIADNAAYHRVCERRGLLPL